MNTEQPFDTPADLKSFESELAALLPAAFGGRDRALYEAGWASCEKLLKGGGAWDTAEAVAVAERGEVSAKRARPGRWMWPAFSAALLLVSLSLGTLLAVRETGNRVGDAPSVADDLRSQANRTAVDDVAGSRVQHAGSGAVAIASGERGVDRASYFLLRNRVLMGDADEEIASPARPSHEMPRQRSPEPIRYRELRNAVLRS